MTLGVDSYLGVALQDQTGASIGNLCLLHQGPIQNPNKVTQILLAFAARSSAELVRHQTNQTLSRLNQLLEEKVTTRTKELALTQSAINLATEGILLVNKVGSIFYVNNATCAFLNHHKKDLLNHSILELDSEFITHIWEQAEDLFRSKQSLTLENSYKDSNQNEWPIEITLNHLDIKSDTYLLLFIRDIRDRKHAEDQLRSLYNESQNKTIQLQKSYQELKETQLQLIQAEKMSSLGQLVAGIAHEINNPITFITGNLGPALNYFEKLKQLLSLYTEAVQTLPPDIAQFLKENDIEYIVEDLPKLLVSMSHGATRIEDIVQSLKTFSRLGGSELNTVDLHENIDSTLVILQNRLNGRSGTPKIAIHKDYGDIPKIECYVSLLNQVFMNLLVNAIDAIEEQQILEGELFTGIIKITTAVIDEHRISVAITDNGLGINPSIKANIFNPFFTTKPVGIGTGMGLSLSYQIVTQNHNGTLSVESIPGERTTFLTELWCSLSKAHPNAE